MTQDNKQADDAKTAEEREIDKTSSGGHLGGTTFGQTPGDAKVKNDREGGDKARPNNGS